MFMVLVNGVVIVTREVGLLLVVGCAEDETGVYGLLEIECWC